MIIRIFFFNKIHYILNLHHGAVVVMIAWMLDLQLHLHSVHITTKIHREGYSQQHYVIHFSVTCDMAVVFSGYSVSSNNITERHDIAERLMKVAYNTIKLTLALPCDMICIKILKTHNQHQLTKS